MTRYCLLVLLLPLAALASWTGLGPFGGPMMSGAACRDNPQVIYASPNTMPARILKSTDGGANWSLTGAASYYAFRMAVHPADPNLAYLAAGGVIRTTNGGTNWNYLSMPGGAYARAIAVHPAQPQHIITAGYAYDGSASRFGTHRSTDGGATWDSTFVDTMRYSMGYAVCFHPTDPQVAWCGGYSGTASVVFKTTDGAQTWQPQPVGVNGYYVYALHSSPLDPDVVLAAVYYSGVYRSTDGGATWAQVLGAVNVNSIEPDPASPAVLWAANDTALWSSSDTGRTWARCGGRTPGAQTRSLFCAGSGVYAAAKSGLYRTTDSGASWTCASDGVVFAEVPTIALSPTDARTAWIEFTDNALFRTTDDGLSWTRMPEFLSCGSICGIALSPLDPARMWALEGSG